MFKLPKYFIFRLAVKMSELDLIKIQIPYVKPYKKSNRVVTYLSAELQGNLFIHWSVQY